MGASQERGELYYVPGTGEKLVRLRTIASPVPGTFTPKLGRTLEKSDGSNNRVLLWQGLPTDGRVQPAAVIAVGLMGSSFVIAITDDDANRSSWYSAVDRV